MTNNIVMNAADIPTRFSTLRIYERSIWLWRKFDAAAKKLTEKQTCISIETRVLNISGNLRAETLRSKNIALMFVFASACSLFITVD